MPDQPVKEFAAAFGKLFKTTVPVVSAEQRRIEEILKRKAEELVKEKDKKKVKRTGKSSPWTYWTTNQKLECAKLLLQQNYKACSIRYASQCSSE